MVVEIEKDIKAVKSSYLKMYSLRAYFVKAIKSISQRKTTRQYDMEWKAVDAKITKTKQNVKIRTELISKEEQSNEDAQDNPLRRPMVDTVLNKETNESKLKTNPSTS